ncbi:MAG: radical SAM protein [Deltaproteobacteria bacterium]|nr:radical SAM protein [Deltaproteobacteria bacterium]
MMFPDSKNLAITVERQFPRTISKASFPHRFGKYSEIKTSKFEFVFDLNGELKFIRGLDVNWPHPAEQLKRTDGNDWVYYSVGDISGEGGIHSWMGEYYLPCLPYPSNAVWEINYFKNANIMGAFAEWSQLYANLYESQKEGLHPKSKELISSILQNHDGVWYERSKKLNEIIGGRVSVLPPDARHVDYEIIPIMIADGCLYHCDFCCVKTAQKFQKRHRDNILEQVQQLKVHYGRNLENYNALFLGNHDALAAGEELICFTASEAFKAFFVEEARAITPCLLLFGSVDSLLHSDNELFRKLNQLPYHTYINIGFESINPSTLKIIGKPLDAGRVRAAFDKMLKVNSHFTNIEVSGNFLIGEQLLPEHYHSLAELLRTAPDNSHKKGAIYLSPLKDSPKKRELLPRFFEIKSQSQLPVYIYLIQRL